MLWSRMLSVKLFRFAWMTRPIAASGSETNVSPRIRLFCAAGAKMLHHCFFFIFGVVTSFALTIKRPKCRVFKRLVVVRVRSDNRKAGLCCNRCYERKKKKEGQELHSCNF